MQTPIDEVFEVGGQNRVGFGPVDGRVEDVQEEVLVKRVPERAGGGDEGSNGQDGHGVEDSSRGHCACGCLPNKFNLRRGFVDLNHFKHFKQGGL